MLFALKVLFGLLLVIVFFVRCSDDNGAGPQPQEFGCPMQLGEELSYDISSNFGNGPETIENGVTVHWLEDLGDCSFLIETSIPRFDIVESTVYRQDEQGLYEVLPGGREVLLFPATPRLGDIYTAVVGRDTIYREVTGVNINVSVPAGSFQCYEIQHTTSASQDDYAVEYISNTLVKREVLSGVSGYMLLELRSRTRP